MRYNWQHPDWSEFTYNLEAVESLLFDFAEQAGRTSGLLEGLPENIQTEAIIDLMVTEAIKTSEIEGEYLSRRDVMSSIRNNLGLDNQNRRPNGPMRLRPGSPILYKRYSRLRARRKH